MDDSINASRWCASVRAGLVLYFAGKFSRPGDPGLHSGKRALARPFLGVAN